MSQVLFRLMGGIDGIEYSGRCSRKFWVALLKHGNSFIVDKLSGRDLFGKD
jgi:hypothetical protein